MHNGKIPEGFVIDHKKPVCDGDEANDNIDNLRIIRHSDNLRKGCGRVRKSNTSGITGVMYNKRDDLWVASICVNSNRISKSFKSMDDAINQRMIWESEYIK